MGEVIEGPGHQTLDVVLSCCVFGRLGVSETHVPTEGWVRLRYNNLL